jgi:hypothetical protein
LRLNRKYAIELIDCVAKIYKIDKYTKKFGQFLYDHLWTIDRELRYFLFQELVSLVCLLLSQKFIEEKEFQLLKNTDVSIIVKLELNVINEVEKEVLIFLDYNILKLFNLYKNTF